MDTRVRILIGYPLLSVPYNPGSSVLRCTDLQEGSGNTLPLDAVLFGSTQTNNPLQKHELGQPDLISQPKQLLRPQGS